jgi:hypothetical protein
LTTATELGLGTVHCRAAALLHTFSKDRAAMGIDAPNN